MITALIVLTSLALYLTVGFFLGRRDLPRFLATQRQAYPSLYGDDAYRGPNARELHGEAAGWLFLWIAFWPIVGAVVLTKRSLVRQVELTDPKEKARRLVEAQSRIAELERELGIR